MAIEIKFFFQERHQCFVLDFCQLWNVRNIIFLKIFCFMQDAIGLFRFSITVTDTFCVLSKMMSCWKHTLYNNRVLLWYLVKKILYVIKPKCNSHGSISLRWQNYGNTFSLRRWGTNTFNMLKNPTLPKNNWGSWSPSNTFLIPQLTSLCVEEILSGSLKTLLKQSRSLDFVM